MSGNNNWRDCSRMDITLPSLIVGGGGITGEGGTFSGHFVVRGGGNSWEGVEKLTKKANFVKICTNLKELGGFLGSHEIFSSKIIVRGGGNSWKSGGKFPEKWSWERTTIRDRRVRKCLQFLNF